jgi:purine-binding chemotaxis protein CheW
MVTVIPLPQASGSLEGVINVRGTAVPVISLRRHFGMRQSPKLVDTHIILIRYSGQTVGLIVDEVISVLDLPEGQLVRTVDMIPHELGDLPLLQGLVLRHGETVLLLDLAHLLRHQRELSLAAQMWSGDEEE